MDYSRFKPRKSRAVWLEGAPDYVVACYDAGPDTGDRYTVLYGAPLWTPDYAAAWDRTRNGDPRFLPARAMSAHPFHPHGIGLFVDAMRGPHLGRKIKWADLPEDCKRCVLQDGLPD